METPSLIKEIRNEFMLTDEEFERLYQQNLKDIEWKDKLIAELGQKEQRLRQEIMEKELELLEWVLKSEAMDKYYNGEKPVVKKIVKTRWKWLNWMRD